MGDDKRGVRIGVPAVIVGNHTNGMPPKVENESYKGMDRRSRASGAGGQRRAGNERH